MATWRGISPARRTRQQSPRNQPLHELPLLSAIFFVSIFLVLYNWDGMNSEPEGEGALPKLPWKQLDHLPPPAAGGDLSLPSTSLPALPPVPKLLPRPDRACEYCRLSVPSLQPRATVCFLETRGLPVAHPPCTGMYVYVTLTDVMIFVSNAVLVPATSQQVGLPLHINWNQLRLY